MISHHRCQPDVQQSQHGMTPTTTATLRAPSCRVIWRASAGVVETVIRERVDGEERSKVRADQWRRTMAVVMQMLWSEATLAQYDTARDKVGWEHDAADGALFHVAWMGDDGLHVVDVWESEQAFNTFAEQRLMPVVKGEIGIEGDPQVRFSKAHRIFDAQHAAARS
jgi:hypothetical protein